MADATYGQRANIIPPTRESEPLVLDARDATILAMTAVGILGTALVLGWLTWLTLRIIPYPSTLIFDIPACSAGVVFTATLMALAKVSGLWK